MGTTYYRLELFLHRLVGLCLFIPTPGPGRPVVRCRNTAVTRLWATWGVSLGFELVTVEYLDRTSRLVLWSHLAVRGLLRHHTSVAELVGCNPAWARSPEMFMEKLLGPEGFTDIDAAALDFVSVLTEGAYGRPSKAVVEWWVLDGICSLDDEGHLEISDG